MDGIITFMGGVLVALVGMIAIPLNKDLEKGRMTKLELYGSYLVVFVLIACTEFIALRGWYLFALTFEYPVFPTYVYRTPLDWLLDAVVIGAVLGSYVCARIHNYYRQLKDPTYIGSDSYRSKWWWITAGYAFTAVICALYQWMKYG